MRGERPNPARSLTLFAETHAGNTQPFSTVALFSSFRERKCLARFAMFDLPVNVKPYRRQCQILPPEL
jgi:hypothetical protein